MHDWYLLPVQTHYTISNLRQTPGFSDAITDRVWNAWWRERGVPRDDIQQLVQDNLEAQGMPFSLVAHRDDVFIGTASVIASDMSVRPEYTPWVAAVWVDEAYRKSGIGSALVTTAAEHAFALGFPRIYLCASAENSLFYEQMGWQRIEEDVDGLNIFVLEQFAVDVL